GVAAARDRAPALSSDAACPIVGRRARSDDEDTQARRAGADRFGDRSRLHGMSDFYSNRDDAESVATLHRALALGVDFLDTSDAYGPHTNEELIGRAIKGRRGEVFLATKFGI